MPMDGGFINGDGNPQMEATAEGRFLSTGDGNPQMEATAEGRFLSTGMAIRGWRQPPKDGCIIIAPGWLAYLGAVAEELIYRRRAVV